MPKHTANRNKSAVKLQRFIRRRRSANAQSVQLVKTNKRINLLQTKLKSNPNKYGLYHEVYSTALTGYTPLMIQPAGTAGTNSVAWANCFSNNTAAVNANRVRLGKLYIHMQFTCYTEPQPITYSVFHVRLTPKNSVHMVQQFGTALAGITTPTYFIRGASSVLPYSANTEGLVMLNPDYFIIKKRWHFTLTNRQVGIGSSQTTNASSTFKNIDYSFPLNYTLGQGHGSWKAVSADGDTKSDLKNYILVFSNNAGADLEYGSVSILCQCTATALE